MEEVIRTRFDEFNFPFVVNRSIIPNDNSTLFVCSGMQQFKNRFKYPDGSHEGSLQSCIRTNDIDLVGDGQHLTYFEMIGNFSFGGHDYENSVELWHSIVKDLRLPVSEVRVHPDRLDHKRMWVKRNYQVVNDKTCTWSDGNISGECCELFVGDLEIGNLVNPLGHSTDVGFGWERLHQLVEGVSRVDETSLFRQDVDYISRDFCRTLLVMHENGIRPGPKGREWICRRMLRHIINYGVIIPGMEEVIDSERNNYKDKLRVGKRAFGRKKFSDKPPEWWWETYGVSIEELQK